MEASRHPSAPPDWASTVADFSPCGPDNVPAGFTTGWRFTVPLIDMPVYVGYLTTASPGPAHRSPSATSPPSTTSPRT
jgi:hypothetical protein